MTRNNEQGTKRWARMLWTAGGALAMGAVLAVALPERARAGDDFERGFKRELGAIAAHEVVGLGRHILVGAVTGHHHHGHSHVRYDGHRHNRVRHHRHDYRGDVYRPYRYGYRYDDRPYRGKRWHRYERRPRRVVERHYYHGPSCGH